MQRPNCFVYSTEKGKKMQSCLNLDPTNLKLPPIDFLLSLFAEKRVVVLCDRVDPPEVPIFGLTSIFSPAHFDSSEVPMLQAHPFANEEA